MNLFLFSAASFCIKYKFLSVSDGFFGEKDKAQEQGEKAIGMFVDCDGILHR